MSEAQAVFERLRSTNRLPSPPGVVLEILELIQEDEVSMTKVTEVIGSDPALTARILKFTNSPLMGLSRRISSLQHAISLIGLRGVKMLALSFSILSAERIDSCPSFDYGRFWSHSLACAVGARVIAEYTKASPPEEAFVAGLLSHFGELLLAFGMPAEYEQVLKTAQTGSGDLFAAEREIIGTTNPKIAAKLFEKWQLPELLCDAIAQTSELATSSMSEADPGDLRLVHILYAAQLNSRIMCEQANPDAVDEVLAVVSGFFSIDHNLWTDMFAQISTQWREYGQLLTIETNDVKPFTEIEAEAREQIVELSLAMQLENQQMREREDALVRAARTDQLTGVGNRPAFNERLMLELDRAKRTGHPLALFLADIDHFKRVNDSYGHQAGDLVLQRVAAALKQSIRNVDLVARYGGEEFAIVAPDCAVDSAPELAERLRRMVEQSDVAWQAESLHVTISVGAALACWPDYGLSANALVAAADQQLYAAKRAGRNCSLVAELGASPNSTPVEDRRSVS